MTSWSPPFLPSEFGLKCYSSGHSVTLSLPLAHVSSSLQEEVVISSSSREIKSSLLLLLPIISSNMEKRRIPMKSNGIAWSAINSNRNSPRVFSIYFTHRTAHPELLQVIKQYETLVAGMWGHSKHHLATRCLPPRWESSLIYALIAASAQTDQLEVMLTNDVRNARKLSPQPGRSQ